MIKLEVALIFLKIAVLLISLFSVVYTSGVVWRVEKKLDVSCKLLLAAILFFILSEALDILDFGDKIIFSFLAEISRAAFSLFFLFGILEMRSMIRKMDGETAKKSAEDLFR